MRYLYKYLIVSLLFLLSFGIYLSTNGVDFKYKFYLVSSDSMSPALKVGDLIVSEKPKLLEIGDIVTFKSPSNLDSHITHRIVAETFDEEKTYITKGDSNLTEDPWPLTEDMFVGEKILSLPFIGYPILLIKSSNIYIVVLGLILLAFSIIEVNFLSKEFVIEFQKFKRTRVYQKILVLFRKVDLIMGKHLMKDQANKIENAGD